MIIRTGGIVAAEGNLRDVEDNGTATRIQQDLQHLLQHERVSALIPKRYVSKPASCDNALKRSTFLMITGIRCYKFMYGLFISMRNTLAYSAERVTTRNTHVAVQFPILT